VLSGLAGEYNGDEGVSLVVGGERRLKSFYAARFFNEV
jgi:hypothetical protein